MIFQRLVLHNFGVYDGRHEIDLEPPTSRQPVVLIGALNGSGKTTILDAIRLVLFGKLAQCSGRGDTSYEDFLRRSIHRNVTPKEGAAVELEFSHRSAGASDSYRVRRSWSVPSSTARERVAVYRNGEFDQTLTDSWAEHAEQLFPAGVAPLFLFDGEKIEQLADPQTSSDVLSTAVHSLLGVDLIDQLSTDLSVVERRKRANQKSDGTEEKLQELDGQIHSLEAKKSELVQERASLQNTKDQQEKSVRAKEAEYRQKGGEFFRDRKSLEAAKASLDARADEATTKLRELAASDLPLSLVRPLVSGARSRDAAERAATTARILFDTLTERDARTLDLAKQQGVAEATLSALDQFLSEDRRKRTTEANLEPTLHLSAEASDHLAALEDGKLDQRILALRERLSEQSGIQEELADVERKLAAVPPEDGIRNIEKALEESRTAVFDTEKKLARVDARLDDTKQHLRRLEERKQTLLRKNIDSQFAEEDSARLLRSSQRARDTLAGFRRILLDRNAEKLSKYVLESYRQLLRKDDLVHDLAIETPSFNVSLTSSSGDRIRPERLSAGERQLLATALLWGLARASGKTLPMVIDTPLGRLDSSHRQRLVQHYFPQASHQVLLLSTDEEIGGRYYEELKPAVGHAYTLEFSEETQSTSIRRGYFGASD